LKSSSGGEIRLPSINFEEFGEKKLETTKQVLRYKQFPGRKHILMDAALTRECSGTL